MTKLPHPRTLSTASDVIAFLFIRRRTPAYDPAQQLINNFRAARLMLPHHFPTRKLMYDYALRLRVADEQLAAIPTLFDEYQRFRQLRAAGDALIMRDIAAYEARRRRRIPA